MQNFRAKVFCSTTGMYLTELVLEEVAISVMADNEDLYPRLDYELHDENGIAIDYED